MRVSQPKNAPIKVCVASGSVVKNLYTANGGEAYSGKRQAAALNVVMIVIVILSLRISEYCHQALYIIYIKIYIIYRPY